MTVSADTQTPSLVALAKNILRNAALLQCGLDVQPTFNPGGRENYHDLLNKPDLMEARSQLIEASKTLLNLTLGPIDVLRSIFTTDRTGVAVLRAIHELKIAESVPTNGSITIDALALSLGVHPTPLRRILGFAHTMGIFHQPTPDCIAHTAISATIPKFAPYMWLHLSDTTQVLSSSSRFAEAARVGVWPTPPVTLADSLGRDFWTLLQTQSQSLQSPSSSSTQSPSQSSSLSPSPSQSSFCSSPSPSSSSSASSFDSQEHEHKQEKDKMEGLGSKQNEGGGDGMALFSAAMATQMHSLNGPGNSHLLNNFPWASLGEGALVVDVGGGNAHVAVDLARAFPNLRVQVQDLERNTLPAKEVIENAGASVQGRVTFQSHDFFTPQPVTPPQPSQPFTTAMNSQAEHREGGVKVFLLSRILHDWPDAECLLILWHLVTIMKASPTKAVKILLMERVLPNHPGEIPLHEEAQIRALDLLMFTTFGAACERSRGEWQALLKRADERLVLQKVTRLEGSELSILEVGLE